MAEDVGFNLASYAVNVNRAWGEKVVDEQTIFGGLVKTKSKQLRQFDGRRVRKARSMVIQTE